MILTDKIGHLVSDESLEELHTFARRLGLRREWFQGEKNGHPRRTPHYDLTTARMRLRAVAAGAIVVSSKKLVRRSVRLTE